MKKVIVILFMMFLVTSCMKTSSYSPLVYAIRSDNETLTERLISKVEINVNKTYKYGQTPLIYGIEHGNIAIIKILIKYGADVNYNNRNINSLGETPLMVATLYKNLAIIKLLLQSGAKVDSPDDLHWTPLVHAVYNHNKNDSLAIIKTFIKAGANVNTQVHSGANPLFFALHDQKFEVIKLLLKSGAKVGLQDLKYVDKYFKNNKEMLTLFKQYRK